MKVTLALSKEIVVEIKDDKALIALDNFYRSHQPSEWGKMELTWIEEATQAVEKETGLSAFVGKYTDADSICGIYAMDGEAILEW